MGGLIGSVVKNLRKGRAQKLLAASTAFSAPPLAFEIYLEHYKGSFGDKWMWTPIWLTPPLTAAGRRRRRLREGGADGAARPCRRALLRSTA